MSRAAWAVERWRWPWGRGAAAPGRCRFRVMWTGVGVWAR